MVSVKNGASGMKRVVSFLASLIPTSGLFLDLGEVGKLWQQLGAYFRWMLGIIYINLLAKNF